MTILNAVLRASDAWRELCFIADGSLFSGETLWSLHNVRELKRYFIENPIEGADRTFIDKLKEQLNSAPVEVIRLTAEVVWFLQLFPNSSAIKPQTKRTQIKEVWEWSGSNLPESPYLSDRTLMGVGKPGIAYLTRRQDQFGFFLDVLDQHKALPEARRTELMIEDPPWQFMSWLDAIEHADRRPIRNAILYFLFPDDLERNLSNDHRRQIVKALKHRLPDKLRPRGHDPTLSNLDRAIHDLRKFFENEYGTKKNRLLSTADLRTMVQRNPRGCPQGNWRSA